jgi:hypothetical protein
VPASAGGRGGDGNGSDVILMTPQMAIKLLPISRMELIEQVREELNNGAAFMRVQEVPNETEIEVGK